MISRPLLPLLEKAIASRQALINAPHQGAFRLFNGFAEGYPDLAVDIYGATALLQDYSDDPLQNQPLIQEVSIFLQEKLNWLTSGIVKTRNGKTQEEKRGRLLFGSSPDRKIKEHGVWHSINLTLNRDASFYLDTRNLRKWLVENSKGKSVFNAFAYTGSLGVAAIAGGAARVVQTDKNRQFLNIAKESHTLNGFPINPADFVSADFFPVVSRFKTGKQLFDCLIVDPPFFSSTAKGKVDQEHDSARIINKVRPLVADGGTLVAINNAVFLSGAEYMKTLEDLCKDGYLKIRELIPVPDDFVGLNRVGKPITDPAPFNHSTKIAVLDVKRK